MLATAKSMPPTPFTATEEAEVGEEPMGQIPPPPPNELEPPVEIIPLRGYWESTRDVVYDVWGVREGSRGLSREVTEKEGCTFEEDKLGAPILGLRLMVN